MRIISISWINDKVLVSTDTGTYSCPMEERDDDFYFKFKNKWHPVSEYADERLDAEIKSQKQGVYEKKDSISQDEFE